MSRKDKTNGCTYHTNIWESIIQEISWKLNINLIAKFHMIALWNKTLLSVLCPWTALHVGIEYMPEICMFASEDACSSTVWLKDTGKKKHEKTKQ